MSEKVIITSVCPTCEKEWSREEYIEIINYPGVLGLTICKECCVDDTIIMVEKWDRNLAM
jgi:Pyruvate/2-oxoacid:ferredoxin oxidoreductase delta subunit